MPLAMTSLKSPLQYGLFRLLTALLVLSCRSPYAVRAQETLETSTFPPEATNETLSIGYITTVDGNSLLTSEGKTISGAVTLAVENINASPDVLPNHTLSFVFADNRGRELRSIGVLTELWKNGAIAFIGPEDFCDTEAKVAASWNLPMVSYKCDDPAVSDKSMFPTFARTQPPSSQSAKSVLALMRHYGWTRFTIVAEDTALLVKAGENLKTLAKVNYLTVNDFVNISSYDRINHQEKLKGVVLDTYQQTRVYVLYSLTEMFIDFVNFMQSMGLTETDEYVIIGIKDDDSYDYSKAAEYLFHASDFESSRSNSSVAAFSSVLMLMSMPKTNPNYTQWEDAVRDRLYQPPFSIPRSDIEVILGFKVRISIFASYLYDAVMIYARALHEVLLGGGNPRNGSAVFERIRDRTFKSILGHDAYIDPNGDAEANYTVVALQPHDNPYNFGLKPVGRFLRDPRDRKKLTFIEDISVFGEAAPLDMPVCGFDGALCKPEEQEEGSDYIPHIIGETLAGFFLLVISVLIGVYRHLRYKKELASLIWKIDPKDIQMQPDGAFSALSIISNNAPPSNASLSFGPDQEQRFTKIGLYKGTLVALKAVHTRHAIDITRNIKLEFKHIRDLRHNNIVQFIGATVGPNVSNIVMEYCSKGSLEDILENSDLKLDHMFIASIVSDIMKGMIYIHSSVMKSHGNLKSSNCLVDSRWVVKISDFGLNEFKSKQIVPYHGEHAAYKRLLWTAPEFLQVELKVPLKGTKSGDVYSFGILLYEILCRNGPYGDCHRTPQDIVHRVRQGPVDGIPFRPNTNQLSCEGYITQVMRECWDENPGARPDMKTCRNRLKPMQRGMRSNIFDNMMNLMERYANNLETVVAERTVELHEEKKKTEMLLHRMLPPSVAAQLVRGDPVIPEAYECVTIYFSDICGFTSLSSESTPLQVVDMLNDLYTLFDRIIKSYDVYKIETIGDAYMVVSGLPKRNGDNHAGEIASMSLNLLTCIKQFKIRHRLDDVLRLRIGIHSGPCVAGVVGLTMPRYTLFGDTVNTASRMESNGEALRIHVSAQCKALLDSLGGYTLTERGLVSMKGKGKLLTYWLDEEDALVREQRTRTSDDSGVQTDLSPSDHASEAPSLLRSRPSVSAAAATTNPTTNTTATTHAHAHSITDSERALASVPLVPCLLFERHENPLPASKSTTTSSSSNNDRDGDGAGVGGGGGSGGGGGWGGGDGAGVGGGGDSAKPKMKRKKKKKSKREKRREKRQNDGRSDRVCNTHDTAAEVRAHYPHLWGTGRVNEGFGVDEEALQSRRGAGPGAGPGAGAGAGDYAKASRRGGGDPDSVSATSTAAVAGARAENNNNNNNSGGGGAGSEDGSEAGSGPKTCLVTVSERPHQRQASDQFPVTHFRQPALNPILKNCQSRDRSIRSIDSATEDATCGGTGSGSGLDRKLKSQHLPNLILQNNNNNNEVATAAAPSPGLPEVKIVSNGGSVAATACDAKTKEQPKHAALGGVPAGTFFQRNGLHSLLRINSWDSQGSLCLADGQRSPGRPTHHAVKSQQSSC